MKTATNVQRLTKDEKKEIVVDYLNNKLLRARDDRLREACLIILEDEEKLAVVDARRDWLNGAK